MKQTQIYASIRKKPIPADILMGIYNLLFILT